MGFSMEEIKKSKKIKEKRSKGYVDILELDGKELSRETDGSVKILEGYESIGDRIVLRKEELDDIIRFFIKVRELNKEQKM